MKYAAKARPHTPGPWVLVSETHEYIHASTTDGRPAEELFAVITDNVADRNLALAAPDLHDALAGLVAAVSAYNDAQDNFHALDFTTASDAVVNGVTDALEDAGATLVIRQNEARAALAKARGEGK